jgi:M6 family metalloprotease-like protein
LNQGLVELFAEATHLADSVDHVDFSSYDAIIVFHAGVGKDFNFGYDATPFDIPSAYISEHDIQTYHVTVPAGVTRGLILPEGENQQEALDFGVELSLNGVLVKLFGNWLGLPDLFDTQTGLSGIGRWGMMDQGSGNLGALVPALPDAWSRAFMGWQQIVTVPPSSRGDSVRLARFDVPGAPEIIKLPVTPREYYLVENRDADADSVGYVELHDRDGRIMRVDLQGNIILVDSLFRVAVSASHYDFGIPGSGLLIWHIDEDVIAAGLPTNSVNADPEHRGVDLVEADAAQDIGQEYGFGSAGSGAELGVPEDAWYYGNAAHRAANRGAAEVQFRDNSYPSARLYDGSFTYYELRNFSPVDSIMSFRFYGTAVAPGFPVSLSEPAEWGVANLNGDTLQELYLTTADSLYRADSSGVTAIAAVDAGMIPSKLQTRDLDGDGRDELLLEGTRVGLVEMINGVDSVRLGPSSPGDKHVYPARSVEGTPRLLEVTRNSGEVSVSLLTLDFEPLGTSFVMSGSHANPVPYNLDSFLTTRFVFLQDSLAIARGVTDTALVELWRVSDPHIQPSAIVLSQPDTLSVFITGYGYVNASDGSLLCAYPDCLAPGVDWDRDGIPDGGGLSGASSLQREDAPHISADSTWVIDLDVNGTADLLGLYGRGSQDSSYTRWIAARHTGGLFRNIPMAASGIESRAPFEWTQSNNLYFVSEVTASGRYYYSVMKLPVVALAGQRFPFQGEVSIINVGTPNPQVHSRPDWLYCWPNPTSDVSRIRVTTAYPAQATVKVFDLSGRKVADLTGSSTAAGPFEILWDVSNVESGVYVGEVKVTGGGSDERAQIKIAVVK